jgi:hypothetical protein
MRRIKGLRDREVRGPAPWGHTIIERRVILQLGSCLKLLLPIRHSLLMPRQILAVFYSHIAFYFLRIVFAIFLFLLIVPSIC